MKPYKLLALCAAVLTLAACDIQTSDYKALKAENDSLRQAKAQMEREMNDYLSAVSNIQQNLDRMKQMENTITIAPTGELDNDDISRINSDISYLNEQLQQNRQQLQQLRSRIKKSDLHVKQLETTIDQLTRQLDTQSKSLTRLEQELQQKNLLIVELNDTISRQADRLEELTATAAEQRELISRQEGQIASAWYVFGTKKELKEQGILTTKGFNKKVLDGDFNKDYFVKIDTRKTTSIPLYSTHAKVLTNHPAASYSLAKDNDNYVLQINDPQEFWSISRYLVIEVD